MIHENEIKNYLKKIKQQLTCSKTEKELIISSLNESIQNYLVEHDTTNMEDIIKKFGLPNDISESYLASLEPEELAHQILIKKQQKKLGITIIIIICCVLIGTFSFMYMWEVKNTPVYYTIDLEEVK